jgi:anti-sigma factor RsiW
MRDEQCTCESRLSAYHDGELDSAARAEVERHLASCPACARRLAAFRGISRLFADAPLTRLSQIAMHRLHANMDLVIDRGLFRLARVLSGVAAVVVIAGSVWLARSRPAQTTATPAAPASVVALVLQTEESLQQQQQTASAEPAPSDWIVQELDR